jgi:hypothetical protein
MKATNKNRDRKGVFIKARNLLNRRLVDCTERPQQFGPLAD